MQYIIYLCTIILVLIDDSRLYQIANQHNKTGTYLLQEVTVYKNSLKLTFLGNREQACRGCLGDKILKIFQSNFFVDCSAATCE